MSPAWLCMLLYSLPGQAPVAPGDPASQQAAQVKREPTVVDRSAIERQQTPEQAAQVKREPTVVDRSVIERQQSSQLAAKAKRARLLEIYAGEAAGYTIYRDATRKEKAELRREPVELAAVVARAGSTGSRLSDRIGAIAPGISRVSATSTKISGSSTSAGLKKA